jgi:hypothetical protein
VTYPLRESRKFRFLIVVPNATTIDLNSEMDHAMWRTYTILSIAIICAFSEAAHAQFGYGIRGAGGLRANGIAGSGGLRGNSIVGSGGLAANGVGPYAIPGGAVFGTFGLSRPYGAFRNQGGGGGGGGNKPFSNVSAQPTVSPYLNLFRNDLDGQANFNYQTLVQPQLQQQRINNQLQRQDTTASRRLQSIAAQADFNPAGSKEESPTGHQTVYNYTGHYFPPVKRPQKPGRQQ